MPLPDLALAGSDSETFPFKTGDIAPKPVCWSYALQDGTKEVVTYVEGGYAKIAHDMFKGENAKSILKIFSNAAFDLNVLCREDPSFFPYVFQALLDGTVTDILVREKLLSLASSGQLQFYETEDGDVINMNFGLADVVKKYFGVDISKVKKDKDGWRGNYDVLAAVPIAEWPPEAVEYAADDADWNLKVYIAQEEVADKLRAERNINPFAVEAFRCGVDFALSLSAQRGIKVNHQEREKLIAWLDSELTPEKMKLLIESGVISPAQPEKPFANGAKNHTEACTDKKTCNCPVKMSAAKKEKLNKKVLVDYVLALKERMPDEVEIRYTPASEKYPEGQVQINRVWVDEHMHLDPLLEEYAHRQKLQQLKTTEVPRMIDPLTQTWSDIVHPGYDCLVRTGRTSSFGSDSYASSNIQNMNPKARECYEARPGRVLASHDYNNMELVTWAQKCFNLFGFSNMKDLINGGIGPHDYLGAQIAYFTDSAFASYCLENGATEKMGIYKLFKSFKEHEVPEFEEFFKHYRKLAKPTGLGYPGGLGANTFRAYAKATFGVDVDLETAKMLQKIWKDTFEEANPYFQYINNECIDEWHPKRVSKKTGYESYQYCYDTPFGMHRAAADYCACANGMGLQAFSAEGALLAFFNVTRACFDSTLDSILLNRKYLESKDYNDAVCWPLAFIHDEIISELTWDNLTHERSCAIQEIMVASFKVVTPDVDVGTSAALMLKWNKNAEGVYDSNGRLAVWHPKPKLEKAA